MYSVWASTDYAGDVNTATWTQLNVPSFPEGNSWTFSDAGAIDLAAFCGKQNVRIAYKYTSTSEASGTWEVDEFVITGNGTPMNNGGGENPDQPQHPQARTSSLMVALKAGLMVIAMTGNQLPLQVVPPFHKALLLIQESTQSW